MGRSDKVRVSTRVDGQKGIFAVASIRRGEVLIEYTGPRIAYATRHSLQIDDALHIEGTEDTNAYLNHCCDPSAYNDFTEAPDKVVLRAMRDLKAGDEVTVDYNAYDFELHEPFRCRCGSLQCYGDVKGFKYLSEAQKLRLRPFLAPHLRRRLERSATASKGRR